MLIEFKDKCNTTRLVDLPIGCVVELHRSPDLFLFVAEDGDSACLINLNTVRKRQGQTFEKVPVEEVPKQVYSATISLMKDNNQG